MWKTKTWKLEEREQMKQWIEEHKDRYIITEIFINNGLCVEYKPLHVIKFEDD